MSTQRKVLVADDSTERSRSLQRVLSAQGWQVILVYDAVSATAATLRERPDAMILGQRLPGGGGLATLRRARASVHTAGIPVIVIVGEREGDEGELRLAGADEYLPSQAEAAVVVACLQKLFAEPVQVIEAPPAIIRNPDRLASLDRTGILDSPPSKEFDTLTRFAAALLSVPVALVSLVDRERQFFKSSIGLPEPWASKRETPLTHSFCQWVVSEHAALVVADARHHPVLRDNRALHELGVVAYAGIPITANSGEAIGSFCAIDVETHDWNETEIELLRELTSAAEALVAVAEFDAWQNQGKAEPEMVHITQCLTTRAVGRGIWAITGMVCREQPLQSDQNRQELFSLLHWLGQQLVRITGM